MSQAHFSFQATGERTLRHGAFQRDLGDESAQQISKSSFPIA